MKLMDNLVRTLREYRRVISISRKPNKDEFLAIIKICSAGVAIIGLIGFAIQFIYQFVIKPVM